ncbi:MAG: pyruvate:ferredoxin (flavodoxin) oxidoreductase [Syntrophotaleaceae bacterium]
MYFQGRETVNKYYEAVPGIVQAQMDKFAALTGRQYNLIDYVGAPDAERVIVMMGSGTDTAHELVDYLVAKGEKVGLLKVRLFLPLPVEVLAKALPASVKKVAVLDRTKEPGALGEPLYQNIRTAIGEAMSDGIIDLADYPTIVGGRYALGSKEFTPAMVKAVFDNLAQVKPKNHFTLGINDDVTGTSLAYDPAFKVPSAGYAAMFYGLGSDGTVGANKNSIKIIGETTDNNVQAYFVYDSKKAGTVTVSHLRFGKEAIRSPYLIDAADFVACHNFSFLEKYDMLGKAKQGATFLLNSPYDKDEVWAQLPLEVQRSIIEKQLKFYVIDGVRLGSEIGLGARINVLMQTAFFAISGIIPQDQAVAEIRDAIVKSYSKAGDKVVAMNNQAVDAALEFIQQVAVPAEADSAIAMKEAVPGEAPEFVKNVTAKIIAGLGDELPVSAMPADGTFPVDTAKYEKRNIAVNIPVWDTELCVQCGICSFMCPHATIRMKIYDAEQLQGAPETFKSCDARGKGLEGKKFSLQVAPEDCTGCGACVHNCPAKSKENPEHRAINMEFQVPLREQEAANWDFFLGLPDTDPALLNRDTVKGSQLLPPTFEFSGACAGCGETPFVKLLSQLYGDRLIMGNATGCSSIYGGNLPTTPWTTRKDGLGPSWNNSLFEDTAEFGYGIRLGVDKFKAFAYELVDKLLACAGDNCGEAKQLMAEIKEGDQSTQEAIEIQRQKVNKLKAILEGCSSDTAKQLLSVADYLVEKSVWLIGGDGWAYDIGYGGLDHVLASGRNVNALVLDTEVYSNTGGQASKATPLAAVAQFAAGGKRMPKKDLALISMTYGNIYVAQVSLANPAQVVKAFKEAESYDGPSLILAYSHCIAHGINMTTAVDTCKKAVDCGHWPLFRYDPRLVEEGKNPLQIDSKEPTISFDEYAYGENRYRVLKKVKPEEAGMLMEQATLAVKRRFDLYRKLSEMSADCGKDK